MNADEILSHLIEKGIVLLVGDSYIITEKYKELLTLEESRVQLSQENLSTPKKLDYDKLLNPATAGNSWPVEIQESSGRARCTALLSICQVPSFVESPTGSYRIWGVNKDAVNIVSNIVDNVDIIPEFMLEAIKLYYKNTARPKSFKNFVLDGDILDIYQEHLTGSFVKSLPTNTKSSGQQWG